MNGHILLIEDDNGIATVVTAALEDAGFTVSKSDSIAGRDRHLSIERFDAMLTDVMLTDGDGIEGLEGLRHSHPDMPIIILSAQNTLDTAIRATETGAFEYFPKPFDLDELIRAVEQAVGNREGSDRRDGTSRAGDAAQEDAGEGLPLVGRSQAMQGVFRMITRVLRNDLTVLILGESGTGKELVADAIHQLGHRKTGPFIAVNAAAIPGELIESELFGHEKGAFTGAINQAIGKFEQANGGTLFLDEIGDMPADAQTRLLRALQSGRIRRVGGRQEISVDVRIVAATNRDLKPMIASGTFREDLFYRLNVVPIQLPPLRNRTDDIGALSRHFLRMAAQDGLPHRQLDDSAIELLERQPWRGNVRELKNAVYRLALMARDDVIDAEAIVHVLDEAVVPAGGEPQIAGTFSGALDGWLVANGPANGKLYQNALAAFEKPLFEHALRQTAGNQLRAAELLGINRNTLRKRLDELAIEPEQFAPLR